MKNKSKISLSLLALPFVIFIFAFFLSSCDGSYSENGPVLDLVRPAYTRTTVHSDSIYISFDCQNIDELRLDNIKQSQRDIDKLCSYRGKEYQLEEGQNYFDFIGYHDNSDGDRDSVRVRLYITYEPN
ncbi:hypothetical protein JW887_05280 [Candidatus Dojkabacteria bacterium]|nr:hypothetical protein [Candidatus Dojkabacteria bacterium]